MPYKISFDKERCIGAFACVVAEPNNWEEEESKAMLKNATYNKETGYYELIVEKIGNNEEAATNCPVRAIKIEEIKNP